MARSRKATPKRAARGAGVAGETLYLVRRVYEEGWDSIFENSAAAFDNPERPEWGGPVKAFAGRFAAEALCKELGAKLLAGKNPFALRGDDLADLTTFPPGPFRDWLLDVGLKPLAAGKTGLAEWSRWWEKNERRMSAEQRHRVLTGLDKLRYYAVAELDPPADDPGPMENGRVGVFTVDLRIWKDDNDFLAGHDAAWGTSVEPCFSIHGLRLATLRDRGRAIAYRDELQHRVPQQSRAFYRNGFGVEEHAIEVEG